MKRIVVLIDGTWNKEGTSQDTNVAKLDAGQKALAPQFIKSMAADGTIQKVHYHDGVGSEGDLLTKLLGGTIGIGLKKIIRSAMSSLLIIMRLAMSFISSASRAALTQPAPWQD